jgi:hypothetical protein
MQTDVLAFRLPASEAEEVRRLAHFRGCSVSDELRRAVRALTTQERVKNPTTSPSGQ